MNWNIRELLCLLRKRNEDVSWEKQWISKTDFVDSRTIVWSDDEEETKRVVRSAKDKRYGGMRDIIKNLKNHKKIKDMTNILSGVWILWTSHAPFPVCGTLTVLHWNFVLISDFEELNKAYDKAKKVVEREGIPRFYIRCLTELETFVNEVSKGSRPQRQNREDESCNASKKTRSWEKQNLEVLPPFEQLV